MHQKVFHSTHYILLVSLISSALLGCSFNVSERSASAPEPMASAAILSSASAKNLPFKIEVLDELNDGKTLYVLARISAKLEWPAQDISIKLSGQDGVTEVRSAVYRLRKDALERGMLSPEKPIEIALEIPSEGVKDYQLEVSWDDSTHKQLLAAHNQGRETSKLVLVTSDTIRRSLGCDNSGCFEELSVRAELLNHSQILVKAAKLGIALEFHQDQLTSKTAILKNGQSSVARGPEQEIELNALLLQPLTKRIVDIKLDSKIPVLSNGVFKPIVRIISYQ